jgi:hypothetical protein
MTYHETFFFSEERSEDLESYWEIDGCVIFWRSISDRDDKSWDTRE